LESVPDPSSRMIAPASPASGDFRARGQSPRPRMLGPSLRPAEARLQLQRRAAANLRGHLRRAATRFTVLVAGDLAAFAGMRALLEAVRDRALLGPSLADLLRAALPAGYLNGWQFAPALVLALLVTGSYNPGDRRRDPRRLFVACALATALPLWTALWSRGFGPVAVHYAVTVVLAWAGVLAERLTVDRLLALVYHPNRDAADTLFVGAADACARVAASPAFAAGSGFHAVGFVDVNSPPAAGALGHLGDFATLLATCRAQAVVVCGSLTDAQFQDVADVAPAAGCQLLAVPGIVETAGLQPSLVWRQGQALIQLSEPSLRGQQLLLKRLVDLIGAVVGLLIASPVLVLVAIAIKLDSGGPVLFGQERIGTGGQRFRVLKFRTMYVGVSDAPHRELVTKMLRGDEANAAQVGSDGKPAFKLTNDARITRLGRWLRRHSLDELPQLINVLRGEMSLVGPRPPLPYEFEQYEHWQFLRLQVRPGMTGLWQVSGRNRLSYRQMCEVDLEYVRDWSLWLDIQILLKTVPVVLSNSSSAY
jgi:exopolysaccharide biosynthesis polyprenyl glycosylphosphotransferase